MLLLQVRRPQVPRPARVQVHWQVPLLPRQLSGQRLGPSAQRRASLEVPGPVLLSKLRVQLKLVHVQSMNGPLVAPQLVQARVNQSVQQRRPGLLLWRCPGVFHRCVHGGHGRNGHVNDAHGVHRCCRCCLRLRPMGCLPKHRQCWLLRRNRSVQAQAHRLGDARPDRRVHDGLHRHAHRVHGDLRVAHALGALRCHRR